jgi:hypothetical protein
MVAVRASQKAGTEAQQAHRELRDVSFARFPALHGARNDA